MVASECAPVAQAGGLGDVVFGLSRELELRGNAVEIILPKYDCVRYGRIYGLTVVYDDLWAPWYSDAIHCTVLFGFVEVRKCFCIEPHSATASLIAGTCTAPVTILSGLRFSARRRSSHTYRPASQAGHRIRDCHSAP
jgi:glycogen synthase